MASYQLSYGGSSSVSEAPVKAKASKKAAPAAPTPPQWFEMEDAVNCHVYVSNLPTTVDVDSVAAFMGKCGVVAKDSAGAWKIKLYTHNGVVKGDAVVTYLKVDSVQLALNILDGSSLGDNVVKVERAKFTMKGDYDATRKPKKVNKRDKIKMRKKQEAIFSWKEGGEEGTRKSERVVVVKNAFAPSDFNEDVGVIIELKEDFLEEANKIGKCRKVDLFDNNSEGALKIFMGDGEEALRVVSNFNGRFFGGKQLSAYVWDGVEKFHVVETEADKTARLDKWEKYVEEDEEGHSNKKPKHDRDQYFDEL